MELVHQDGDSGGFYLVRGDETLGEMTYKTQGNVLLFDHTWVDDSLRGQGKARELLDAAMSWVRTTGKKVEPVCPYVRGQFDKDASLADLRA